MLALVFSFVVAVYLLGPDLISRWIIGFAVPRRAVVQTRAEEVTRAVIWAVLPLLAAFLWARLSGAFSRNASWGDLHVVFSGLYSTVIFERSESAWYASARALAWWNLCVLWRLYLLIVVVAFALNTAVRYYGPLRRSLPYDWLKTVLAIFVLPRVAEWHVLLSPMLLPERSLELHADVLTRSGTLYQGRITDKVLNADGSIQSVTLTEPKRFQRERYQAAQGAGAVMEKEHYWAEIAGNVFVILGGDISNINLRYRNRNNLGLLSRQLFLELLKARNAGKRVKH